LGSGVCKLFQKGTLAYSSCSDGMEPMSLHMSHGVGTCSIVMHRNLVVILLFQEGRNMKVAVASVLRAAE
jgi:hypothetical protein